MKRIWNFPFTLIVTVFGRLSWSSPSWLAALGRLRRQKPLAFVAALLLSFILLTSLSLGYQYYQSLPGELRVKAQIHPLNITKNQQGAEPDPLIISFDYDFSLLNENQPRPQGLASVARIDLAGQPIKTGIALSPTKKGRWRWLDDRQLMFTPEGDWPAGMHYKVTFNSDIFAANTVLATASDAFMTPELDTKINSMAFYQDPQDSSVRRVIATLVFSHPIDKHSLESRLSLRMAGSGQSAYNAAQDYDFSITYDKNLRQAYVQSVPLALPAQSSYMTLVIDSGVVSSLTGAASAAKAEQKVGVPDKYSLLKIDSAQTQIVSNQQGQPEQVLTLNFTDAIEQGELLNKLALYRLPEKDQAHGTKHWQSPGQVSHALLSKLTKIELKMIPNPRAFSTSYSFTFDVTPRSYLYLKIAPGLTSTNDFVHAAFFDDVLRAPNYPKQAVIKGQGSLMSYSGQHKLSIMSRGLGALKYRVGQVQQNQLNHLVSQTRGDISNPEFKGWNFDSNNLAAYSEKIVKLGARHAKEASYSSLDLSQFLINDEGPGLFFIQVLGWDDKQNRRVYSAQDQRLVLVTDLGLIVKNNTDQSRDVFIQSVKTGDPVAGASVELLGQNGIALFSATTNHRGHVRFATTENFQDEQKPTVYVVKKQGDTSFIPFDRFDRQLNLSKFDIGGVSQRHFSAKQNKGLNAFMFSDRGIYRPGETVNLAAMVKTFDFGTIEDIPLELVISGPRYNEVKVKKLSLAKLGFFDFQYKTLPSSDTGNYRASLHLVRNKQARGREIGAVSFKVEEFQPDRMKIDSQLLQVADSGWTDQTNIGVKVSLQNLFGVPAQNRKVTGRVIIEPTNFLFKHYAGYKFSHTLFDQAQKPLRLDRKLASQQTDADGLAKFTIPLTQFKQGAYSIRFIAQGFEAGAGRSVVATNRALFSPQGELVGVKSDGKLDYIYANSQRNLTFIAVDKSLKQIEKKELRFKLRQIQHISTLVKQDNNTYQYQRVKKETQLSDQAFSITAQGSLHAIDTGAVGHYAIEIFDNLGQRLSRLEYHVVGQGNLSAAITQNAELQLKLNKGDYKPGQLIEMNIRAPYVGAGLISIETDKVEHFKWFKAESQSSMQSIRLPEHLEGSAYVNVSFVRDANSHEIFTPALSYAVQPLSIDKGKRQLALNLKVKPLVRPGHLMQIHYSAAKVSRVAIFAIDQGILQVANYKTPDPLAHFLKKRALGVETLQTLDLILAQYNLLKGASASGGGSSEAKALASNLNPFARKTDKPAIFWSGIVDAGPELKSLDFAVPDTFAGTLKVMAVAVAPDAVGFAEQSTLVRGPFVLSPNVLTQAAPGDEFVVTLGVANLVKNSGKAAAVEVAVSSSLHLQIIGDSSFVVNIDEGGEGHVSFRVKASQDLGSGELHFSASHKNERSSRTASLSVRPAMPYSTHVKSGFSSKNHLDIPVPRKLYANLAQQQVSASASPLLLVDGLSAYLAAFPHACTEQVVSQVFPLVGLLNHPSYAAKGKDINVHFDQVIDKLRGRQLAQGGFSFWPGGQTSAQYPSIYVMHFLIEAQSLGYPVPKDMLQRGSEFLVNYVARGSRSMAQAHNRANAIYLLSRLGRVTTNFIVDLEKYLNKNQPERWQKSLTGAYIAAAYRLMHQDVEAQKLISAYQWAMPDKDKHDKDHLGQRGDFHSPLSQNAQYILLLAKHFQPRAKLLKPEQVHNLTSSIFNGEYNTISSAYSILALGAYSRLVLETDVKENITFSALKTNGTKTVLASSRRHPSPFLTADYGLGIEQLRIQAEQAFYYLNVQSGFEQTPNQRPITNGIEIQRDFFDQAGNKVTSFEQGKELQVRLRVRALDDRQLSNIAVVDLLPGGFEVIRSSVSRSSDDWQADHLDIREDRVLFYGRFGPRITELSYKVKLTASGTFVIPPSTAESMYDRAIRAVSGSGSFIVTPGQDEQGKASVQ